MPAKRIRLRELLKSLYPENSSDELFAGILCGDVRVNGEVLKNPAVFVDHESEVIISPKRFVSRGGYKLSGALEAWGLKTQGLVFVDAGASTGGFTDALLQSGASFVHAVDVGYNQLAYSLRMDARVKVWESTNIFDIKELEPLPDAAVADLSFRSLRGVAGHILGLTSQKWMVALVKPQFELTDSEKTNFQGVIHDLKTNQRVVEEVLEDLKQEGIHAHRILPSSLRGRRGNQEFLVHLSLEPLSSFQLPWAALRE